MSIHEAVTEAVEAIETSIADLPHVSAAKIGLDPRAGYVYVDVEDRYIITHGSSSRSLDYYGGFEYVEEGNITVIGPYKIYAEEGEEFSTRVNDALEFFEAHEND